MQCYAAVRQDASDAVRAFLAIGSRHDLSSERYIHFRTSPNTLRAVVVVISLCHCLGR